MDQASELLQTAVFRLRNIALFDNGKAFSAELHIKDHELMRGDSFRKTTLEGKPTRALLRPNAFRPSGTVQLTPVKGVGLRAYGRVWDSYGLKVMKESGVALSLQFKPIKMIGDQCVEAKLFTVSLTKETNAAN